MPTTPTSSIGLLEDNLKTLTLKDGIVFTSTNIHAQYRKVIEETVFLPK